MLVTCRLFRLCKFLLHRLFMYPAVHSKLVFNYCILILFILFISVHSISPPPSLVTAHMQFKITVADLLLNGSLTSEIDKKSCFLFLASDRWVSYLFAEIIIAAGTVSNCLKHLTMSQNFYFLKTYSAWKSKGKTNIKIETWKPIHWIANKLVQPLWKCKAVLSNRFSLNWTVTYIQYPALVDER